MSKVNLVMEFRKKSLSFSYTDEKIIFKRSRNILAKKFYFENLKFAIYATLDI